MRFAYADPPYPGQAKRLYAGHPDYAGEVDHAELITHLASGYDGWALSTSVEALQGILALCPPTVRVAVWNVTNRRPFSGAGRWHQSWEPVIIEGGRLGWGEGPAVRDLLSCGALADTNKLPGQKPRTFARWIFDLLGLRPDDELDDVFPGSKTVSREWQAFRAQQSIPLEYSRTRKTNKFVPKDWPTLDGTRGTAPGSDRPRMFVPP